jgi:hypothetical protein
VNGLAQVLAPLLGRALERFFPGGAAKAREPSTIIGLAELTMLLTAILAHFGYAPELAEPIALVVLGVLGVVNVLRPEKKPPTPDAPAAAQGPR